MPKYNRVKIERVLDNPGAARELNQCIWDVYKSLDYEDKRDVDNVGKIIQANMKRKYGHLATKFRMGDVCYAELAIRLSILMIQEDCDADGLRKWIQGRE